MSQHQTDQIKTIPDENFSENCHQSEKTPEKSNIAMPCPKRIVLEPGKTYLYCMCF